MAAPLNPTLYRLLRRHFGDVKICADGEAMNKRVTRDLAGDRHVDISHAGEYMRVNCPFCNDTRYRLYVNHMYGQDAGDGRKMWFLAICYNENCFANENNRESFRERLEDVFLPDVYVRPGRIVPEEAEEVLPPGDCIPLEKLPDTHQARAYIRSRQFDPDLWGRDYRVAYCPWSRYSLATNRIIFPVYEREKLKGWQARFIGELDWKGPKKTELPPKYFSCPGAHFRSRCIYQLDRMKEWETGILVEGPTDVISFGSMSGGVFGNSVTQTQRKKFLAHFRKRTGVLLLDPEEYESESTVKLLEFMQTAMPGTFCAVKLPDGTDPGKLDREAFLKPYVKEQAARKGVKVVYRRVRKAV